MDFRLLAALLLLLLLVPGAQAVTKYDIVVQGNDLLTNVTFELYTSEAGGKVNYWTTTFSVPPGSQILSVSDSKGPITTYNVTGGNIAIITNKGGLKEKEVVTLVFLTKSAVDTTFAPLQKLNLSLAAFGDERPDVPDEQTFVTVTVPQIISHGVSLGFVSDQEAGKVTFAGDGPVSLRVLWGSGKKYGHYELFGKGNLTVPDLLFGIPVSVTGTGLPYTRIPVVVLPDQEYAAVANDWSEGQYTGSMILLRESVALGEKLSPVLLHETVHALNEWPLRWDRTEVAWFDEGTAKYVEFLVNKKLKIKQAEIFGGEVQWVDGFTLYTLQPRQTPDDLWNYYTTGKTFMNTWNPQQASTREFGYAFGELVVRDAVLRGVDLHEAYEGLQAVQEYEDNPAARNQLILGLLDSDFRPCFASSQAAMESCLESINKMAADIPANVTLPDGGGEIIIPDIEPPVEDAPSGFLQGIIDAINGLIAAILGLFGGSG
ncbi:MAG: hypothetical protein HY369_05670 [Candidatus Aenigmarchaeota archaeon]|nr:hypothetical protein [Candidatus Aenigmarchaeota archaeon]